MRVGWTPPSTLEYDTIFLRGGGLKDIKIYTQRGGSLFSFIGRFIRNSIPFLKQVFLPEAGNYVRNVTRDIGRGATAKQAFRNNGVDSLRNIGRKVVGAGKKKTTVRKTTTARSKVVKSKTKKTTTPAKRKNKSCFAVKSDIFTKM